MRAQSHMNTLTEQERTSPSCTRLPERNTSFCRICAESRKYNTSCCPIAHMNSTAHPVKHWTLQRHASEHDNQIPAGFSTSTPSLSVTTILCMPSRDRDKGVQLKFRSRECGRLLRVESRTTRCMIFFMRQLKHNCHDVCCTAALLSNIHVTQQPPAVCLHNLSSAVCTVTMEGLGIHAKHTSALPSLQELLWSLQRHGS